MSPWTPSSELRAALKRRLVPSSADFSARRYTHTFVSPQPIKSFTVIELLTGWMGLLAKSRLRLDFQVPIQGCIVPFVRYE